MKGFMVKYRVWVVGICLMLFVCNSPVFASEPEKVDDLDVAIKKQETLIAQLNAKKQEGIMATVKSLQEQQKVEQLFQEDVKSTLGSFQRVLDSVQLQQQELSSSFQQLMAKGNGTNQQGLLDTIAVLQQQQQDLLSAIDGIKQSASANKVYEPSVTVTPVGSFYGNTQDAVNAQRDAEMTFAYSPGGMYKIYCKTGYLTDIRFHAGEKVTFVGGGDTAKWMIDTANTGSGDKAVAHLYIKPINSQASTNLIVNTTNHSYQILVETKDWYNPIVSWSYSSEEQLAGKIQKEKDDAFFTEKGMNLSQPELMNFDYKIKNDRDYRWAPVMVFDDCNKTYIKMPDTMRQGNSPVLFVKERGKKELSLVNYRIKDNYYIVDRIFDAAELRVSEKETVKIVRK